MRSCCAAHATLLLTILSTFGVADDAHPGRPNILFVLVDDFGPRDLSCYGSELYETPQMDALAASGARFTQAYVAYPRCVPSRFAILTGKHPAGFQKDRDSVHVELDRDVTFGQAFQQAGYKTFYCGKWHLGEGPSDPSRVGFSHTVAAGGAGATRSHFAPYTKSRNGGQGEQEAIVGLDDAPEDEYLTDRLTAETLKFIDSNRDGPFLAVLAHYAVHTPLEAKQHLTRRYAEKLEGVELPEQVFEPESAGENLIVQNNPTYAAMIESVDHGVGRLLRLIDRLKIADHTIVVLASDHGGLSARGGKREVATSNRPFRAGKGHLYEGGLRIPLLIRWPGHTQAGRVIDEPVISMDLFPTFLEIAGLPLRPEAHRDGVSLAGLLDGDAPPQSRNFFWHNPAPRPSSTADLFSSAVRSGNLKLVEFPTENRTELYDLQTDISEAHNLAADRPDDVTRLQAELHEWKQTVGAANVPRLRKKELRR
ncbi:MAG: sulfatase [Planctomycetaceae bacterium]|nr:sulfatase [Planctomycetaceae bacterium]